MKLKSSIKLKLAGLCLFAASGFAQAADLNLGMPKDTSAARSFMLASNDTVSANLPESATNGSPKAEFVEPMFSGDKIHQYAGLTTLALTVATAFTAPDNGCEANCPPPGQQPPRQVNGTHAKLAKAAAAMAAFTVTSGLIDHWDDFHMEDGFSDPDNLHALLGTAGAALMMYAVNKSAKSAVPVSHAGIAELGGFAMAFAVKLTW